MSWLRRTLLAVLLFGASNISTVFAQNIDSLRKELAEHPAEDTTKAKLYLALADALRYTDPPTSGILGRNAYALCTQLNYTKGQSKARLTMAMALLITGDSMERAVDYCNDAVAGYEAVKDTSGLGSAHFILASVRYNQSRYETSIKHFQLAADLYGKVKNDQRQALALDNLGVCCSAVANYPAALTKYLQALKIRERIKDYGGQAASMGNIAQIYANLDDTAQAIAYVKKSVALTENYGEPNTKMITYENAGGVYGAMNDYKSALVQFSKAIEMAKAGKLFNAINRISVNAAEMHIGIGNYDEAEKLYRYCLTNQPETNNPAVVAMINRGMGRILVHKGKLREGIAELETATRRFEENEMKNELYETYNDLSRAYEKNGNFQKALDMARQYHTFLDSLHRIESSQTHKLQYEYELQEKGDRIHLLENAKALDKARAEKQRVVSWSLVGGLVLLGAILVTMLRASRREKTNKQKIVAQAESLQQLNNFKDKIFSVLSHDLRGPIGSLSVSMSLFEQDLMNEKEFKEMQPELSRQLTSVNFLLENLLSWSKSHITGDRKQDIVLLNLKRIAGHSITLMQPVAQRKSLTLHDDLPASIRAWGDENKVDIIIRNLLSNAIKFTPTGGSITLSAKQDENSTSLSVTDTGVGMTPEQLSKLFTPRPGNTFGTEGEKGVGLGLVMSFEFARALNGDIKVTSQPEKGTTFTLVLPTNKA